MSWRAGGRTLAILAAHRNMHVRQEMLAGVHLSKLGSKVEGCASVRILDVPHWLPRESQRSPLQRRVKH